MVRRSSQAEVKGQVGLPHLLSVYRIKLFIHRHGEDIFPQTNTTCREMERSKDFNKHRLYLCSKHQNLLSVFLLQTECSLARQ